MLFTIVLTFKKLTNALLVLFVNFVVSRMKNNATYVDEAAQVLVVETANTAFSTAITAAGTGDHTNIALMRKRRDTLENELTILTKMLELHPGEDVTFFTFPGFEVRKKPTRNLMPLTKPVIKALKQGVLSGTLDGEVVELPDGVTQVALQHSSDGGIAWTNGSYATGKRFSIEDLTPRNALNGLRHGYFPDYELLRVSSTQRHD